MRNVPLKGFIKKSPMKVDAKGVAKTAVKIAKPLVKGAAKRALGVAGLFLSPASSSKTDQPGKSGHGGKATGSLFDIM